MKWIYLNPDELKKNQEEKNEQYKKLLDSQETKFDLGPEMTCDIEDLIPGFRVKK